MTYTYNPKNLQPIHPGITLQEMLDFYSMSQMELAKRTGLTKKTINELVKGHISLTPDTAIKLERVFGISQKLWNNLNNGYLEVKAYQAAIERMQPSISITSKLSCYDELVELGWIETKEDVIERTESLLSFFGVDSLTYISDFTDTKFKKSKRSVEVDRYALASWLRKGEQEAHKINISPFNKDGILKNIPLLRKLSFKNATQEIVEVCNSNGLKVVYTQHLSNTDVVGASRWLSPTQPLIQISTINQYDYMFWTTFFHELGHILLHKKRRTYIDFQGSNNHTESIEDIQAEKFVWDTLIPQNKYNKFLEDSKEVTNKQIKTFAQEIQVLPSILATRLAKDGVIPSEEIQQFRKKVIF